MNSDRRQILDSFLENIAGISDQKYQERVWVRIEGPECDDIDDTILDFFDDGNPILDNFRDFEITDTQHRILMELHKKLDIFTKTYGVFYPYKSTEQLINTPEWLEIRELAKTVLQAFNYQKKGFMS